MGPRSHLLAPIMGFGALTRLRDAAAVRAQKSARTHSPSSRVHTRQGCRLLCLDCDGAVSSGASCMQQKFSPERAAGLCDVDFQVLRQRIGRGQLQGALDDALCLLGTGAHAAILLQGGGR